MKFRVSITREYDIDGEHEYIFEGINDKAEYAMSMFSTDIDTLVKYNEVTNHALLEVIV